MEKEIKYFKADPGACEGMDIDALKASIEGEQDRFRDYLQNRRNAGDMTLEEADAAFTPCYNCGQKKLQAAADKLFATLVEVK